MKTVLKDWGLSPIWLVGNSFTGLNRWKLDKKRKENNPIEHRHSFWWTIQTSQGISNI